VKRNEKLFASRDFTNFWNKLIRKTEYQINIEKADLIELCVNKLANLQFPEPHIVITKGTYVITNYRIELLGVKGDEAKIGISKTDSQGQEER